ncbi:hypothetical protein HR060_02105 [Catenovulum sp. SM1970]|uniref:hypothetical protein n=1 Tax=Marinifaba aquimaris TaxID=2741323 RepID=UPI0015723A82|nr:hypothetical protein [Marinifaba aquimaris]NTS75648.1 hypothetical protein [Marinifaba aquimaris]
MMSRKVIYLNLLKDANEQAVEKLGDGLKTKYSRNGFRRFFGNSYEVIQYDVFEMLRVHKLGVLNWSSSISQEELNAIRLACQGAWKIFVSAHGHMNCTDYVYGGQFYGKEPLAKWDQVSSFLTYLLPNRNDKYKIELMICYAARTMAYREGQQARIAPELLSTSLAYKLFKNLGENRTVRVTSRSGATGFDELQGCITVETDEHAELEYERRTVLETPDYKNLKNWVSTLTSEQKRVLGQKFLISFNSNGGNYDVIAAVQANGENEEKFKRFALAQARYRDIRAHQNTLSNQSQYGTICYDMENSGIKIKNVFTSEVFYEGSWI